MREKLRTSRGETLVEVLASVLVCSLSIMLLLGAVTASTNIDLQVQAADGEYYTALTKAERQSKAKSSPVGESGEGESDISAASGGAKVTVTSEDGKTATISAAEDDKNGLHFYGAGRLLSYAMDPPPETGLDVTGGGG